MEQRNSLLAPHDLDNIRVFVTTVIRGSDNSQLTGFLIELDWLNSCTKKMIPIPLDSSNPFWNARGGNRGGRGVAAYNNILYVATATSILKYSLNLTKTGELNHPYLAGLHEIFPVHDGLWVTSTVHDLIMKLNFDGEIMDEWWGSENQLLQKTFGYSGRNLNLDLTFPQNNFETGYNKYCEDERLHLNAVYEHSTGVYALSCRKKALIKIRPLPEQLVFTDNQLSSPHNIAISHDDKILINDTQNQRIRIYDLYTGTLLNTIDTFLYNETTSEQFVKAGWQRGLSFINDSICLSGTSPATVFEVNINSGVIGKTYQIDSDIRHCIHGLTVTKDF